MMPTTEPLVPYRVSRLRWLSCCIISINNSISLHGIISAASPTNSFSIIFILLSHLPSTTHNIQAPGSTYTSFIDLKSHQLRNGKLWISQYIDDNASNSIISSLLYLQSEAKKTKMELYLHIPGADLRPALAIYDALNDLKAGGVQLTTVNVALCAGMGALIAGAGTRGHRRCMPNARFLLQKTGMEGVFRGQASDIALEVASIKLSNENINREFARVCGQSVERIEEDLKRDFYLSSDEAVRYGLIDEVWMPSFNKRRGMAGDPMLDFGVFSSGPMKK
jgi:ATP-dependent Clp protease protease subunit